MDFRFRMLEAARKTFNINPEIAHSPHRVSDIKPERGQQEHSV